MKKQLQIQKLFNFFLVPLGLIFLVSCENDTSKSLENIVSKTIQASDSAIEQVGNLNADDAKKEFKKLSQFEYQVLSVKKEIPTEELEGRLAVYGANGFDCSPPVVRAEDMITVCKRRPESYLRYIPQTIVGRP